ncbi:NAD(P)-binding protein [Aspergillus steynii IBT 23096]|uniref:NAD(P)-binding protein n=1 Tax=Aspergillus steynii IBT 23096 TaxID=1392250 RepID=A0A2I2FXX4_9EURO|nr:NAD(P)-binding protein [Aspergillus steynii IBT 23096]PLB45477.1 NAD(P)-binding protein [Aspergillus steynii IBT 23096]
MSTDERSLKKVLLSGGSGFVGAAIARAIAEKHPQCSLTIIDLNPPGPMHIVPGGVAFVRVDVTNKEEVSEAFQRIRPDIVIHTAGIVPGVSERFSRRLESLTRKINVEGTRNMLEAAKRSGVKGFVYTSSCCVVTDYLDLPFPNIDERWPASPSSLIYGESKATAEALVIEESGDVMATCSLRPSVLCGPGDTLLVPSIHACIAKSETPFIIGDGFNLWDVTYVSNIADAHVLAAENLMSSRTAAGEVFFIQNNEPITFRDFCLAVWSHFGHIPPFEVQIPKALAHFAGLMSECLTWVLGTPATLSRGSVKDACSVRYASGVKAKTILGYEARIGLEDGIRLSCEDYARRLGIKLPAQKQSEKEE